MSALQIEPAEGYVALEFLDGNEDDESPPSSRSGAQQSDSDNLVFAMCVGTGKKVTCCKRGDTVVVMPYARQGMRVSDDVVIVEAYLVKGIVKG